MRETEVRYSEEAMKFQMECSVHGVIATNIGEGEIKLEELVHRENMGCIYPIDVKVTHLPTLP